MFCSARCYTLKYQREKCARLIIRTNHWLTLNSTMVNLKLTNWSISGRQFSTNTSQDQQKGKPGSWIESAYIPEKIRPYLYLARADKQAGTLLLMWPCFWSVCLATPIHSFPDAVLLLKFATGALIMRGAGCTINDMWDRDFDKHVERTKDRPLASGALNLSQAMGFLTLQLSAGLAVLVTFNTNTILLGFLSMPLVVVYPLMKRFTNWPQLILGFTFNWGALVGYTASVGELSLYHALPLYVGGICWTLVYDTLYGYQDRKDDASIGVKSTALYLGDRPQWPLTAISSGMLGCLILTGIHSDLSWPYYLGSGSMWLQLQWQIWTADIHDPKNLWQRFNSNKYTGGLLALAIAAGHI